MKITYMKITEIKEASPFKDLFEIKPEDFEAIQQHMATPSTQGGYDPAHPITIWKEKGVIVDGHTRFQAAKSLYENKKLLRSRRGEFDDIPVVERSFKTEEEALEYAIHNQTERRNLSEWDILQLVDKMDERLRRGGDRRSEEARLIGTSMSGRGSRGVLTPSLRIKKDLLARMIISRESTFGTPKIDSRERTADIIGISKDKVSLCRYILENCDDKTLKSIREGYKTLHQVYENAHRLKREERAFYKKQENKLDILKGYKVSEFLKPWKSVSPPVGRPPRGVSKLAIKIEAKKRKGMRINRKKVGRMVDRLFQDYIPALTRYGSTMEKIKFAVEFLIENELDETLYRQPGFKEFLSSQLVSNFIYVLGTFGFKIEVPEGLEMKEPSKKVERDERDNEWKILAATERLERMREREKTGPGYGWY